MLRLYEYVKKITVEIHKDGLIGRKGSIEPSFFWNQRFISEEHCEIYKKKNCWFVRHVGDSHPTRVNGMIVHKESSMRLKDGDILQLADLWFKVAFIEEEEDKMKEIIKYKIVCPVCGKEYYGKDEFFRVSQCITPSCFADSIDCHRVAKIRPVKEVSLVKTDE